MEWRNCTVGGDLFNEDRLLVHNEKGEFIGQAEKINGIWMALSANGKTKIPCPNKQSAIEELKRQAVLTEKKVEKRNTDQLSLF